MCVLKVNMCTQICRLVLLLLTDIFLDTDVLTKIIRKHYVYEPPLSSYALSCKMISVPYKYISF